MMRTQLIGQSGLRVGRLGYGCMRISGSWDRTKVDAEVTRRAIKIVEAAFEAGYTLFDHADIYGDTACESLFGEALKLHPGWREQMVIVTKCGICFEDEPKPGQPHRYDFSHDHIIDSVHGSLGRLGIETIDLLLLHRPDFLADPEEICRAFVTLREAGKVREFGVSNFRPSLFSAVQAALPFPLVANQVEIHPQRLDAFTDGTLDQCLERHVTPMSWSPIAGGRVGTGAEAKNEHHRDLLAALDKAATDYSTDRTNIALAWLLRHPSGILPIVGSANPDRIRSAVSAAEIEMDRDTWYHILRAARGVKLP
ncbi:MAG: aldo/keto reductase [Opitutaceae bacterium]